jgi:hypothetical protein
MVHGSRIVLAAVASLIALGCSSKGNPGSGNQTGGSVILNDPLSGVGIFPPDNWWNLNVSLAPLDSLSDDYIAWIGQSRQLHPDLAPPPYGMPYMTVPGTQPLERVAFVLYGSESDSGAPGRPAGYPIPLEARVQPNYIEGGVVGGGTSGDRHLLIIDRDRGILFELFAANWNSNLQRWEAGSGAVFDLAHNDRRPEGWTSADAAGLAIFAGLVRYDEAYGTVEIRHAFRFTTRATNGHVWPASHSAGNTQGAPPMGARLRLKASVDLSPYAPAVRRIFEAMQRYGLILADNGSDMMVQGTMDERWDNDVLNPAFHSLTAGDFEVVQLGWRP